MCKWLLNLFGKPTVGDEDNPAPPVHGTIDINAAASIVLDVAEAVGWTSAADLFLPDKNFKLYKKDDVQSCYALDEVSAIKYVAEEHDCDDFAARLFGHFAGLAWTNVHALNWFIDENLQFWWIEPQSGKLSKTLEAWQGAQMRFFLGR